MSRIGIDLESIQVTDGQGVGEGDFEMRVQVQEGKNNVVWPNLNGWIKVDKNGPAKTINKRVGVYSVDSGTLSKRFTIDVTEVDGGTLGQDDEGHNTVTFELTPNMAATTKSTLINLFRPNMNFNGQVKVVLSAQLV